MNNKFKLLLFLLTLLFVSTTAYSATQSLGTVSIGGFWYHSYYSTPDESFALRFAVTQISADIPIKHYKLSTSWLSSEWCAPYISGNSVKANFNPNAYMTEDRRLVFSGNSYDTQSIVSQTALDMNYKMKVDLKYTLKKDGIQVATTTQQNERIGYSGITYSNPYASEPDYGIGEYEVFLEVIPKDLKCDFNSNGVLSGSEIQSSGEIEIADYEITIPAPTLSLETTKYVTSSTGSISFSTTGTGVSCDVNNGATSVSNTGFSYDLGGSDLKVYTVDCSNLGGDIEHEIYVKLDTDSDGIIENEDNCPTVSNPSQSNNDYDSLGDACDIDDDNDGIDDIGDICPVIFVHITADGCPDSDLDSVRDDTMDLCIGVNGDPSRRGCPAYTLSNSCQGSMSFNQNNQDLSCYSDMQKIDTNYDCEVNSGSGCGWTDIAGAPSIMWPNDFNRGSNRYLCVEDDSGFWIFYEPEEVRGYCDLEFHPIVAEASCTSPITGDSIVSGTGKIFFSKKTYEFGEERESEVRICNNGVLSGTYQYNNPLFLSPDTAGTNFDPNSETITYDDSDTRYKTEYNIDTKELKYLEKDGSLTSIPIEEFNTTNKNIKIYKQGVLDREEEVDPIIVAIKAHKIRKFNEKEELVDFVDDSVSLMNKLQIVKDLKYNLSTNKTKVQIRMEDIPQSEQTNITIYQVISKDLAESIDNINFISDGGAQRIIIDKDPVIGWYFNDSDENESIEYEIEGESEGGTIIITQEPILYNEGELIINYREGGCNPDEAYLFDLEDLEDSPIYSPGSGQTYNICVAHLTEPLYADVVPNPFMHILNYTTASNASIDGSYGISSVDISVSQLNPKIYWDMKVQETNPNGNYSCLGSVNNEGSSLFGDCGYTLNRIWLHLGADYFPPNTTMSYPYISHTVRVELDAVDNIGGSGIDSTYYCFDSTGDCNPVQPYNGPFSITCEFDWGCVKYVKFYSIDVEGNVEEEQIDNIRILDKGSACSEDCTAKPSPNRYLKECRNLNSCEYFPFNELGNPDDGEYVAEQCDFLIKDSWVGYNDTHDIQCPNGPLRLTKFTSIGTDTSSSSCLNVIKTPFITLLDGEQVIMNILNCNN